MDKLVNNQIQYIEFTAPDLGVVKEFYSKALSWNFIDYGETYTAFSGKYVDGGFTKGEAKPGSTLVVLYANELETTKEKVLQAGGVLDKDIFSFPGGRRFEFKDPAGNLLAVWSE